MVEKHIYLCWLKGQQKPLVCLYRHGWLKPLWGKDKKARRKSAFTHIEEHKFIELRFT